MKSKLVIGTRGSRLAMWQAEHVSAALKAHHPDLEVALQVIRTTGDHIQDVPLARIGGKGLFIKEIEEALLDRRCDLAVHSLKDVPDTVPDGLILAAYLEREMPYDAFVSDRFERLADLPDGARVGTSSLRRAAQLRHLRPDLEVVALRGNLDTRLRRLREGLDAVILAAAGLRRLGLSERIREVLTPPEFVPAVGQGVVVVECRADDPEVLPRLQVLDHERTRWMVRAERAFLAAVGGGCQVPLGAHAQVQDRRITVIGMIARADGGEVLRDRVEAAVAEAEDAGARLAARLLAAGGARILRELEQNPPWGR